MKVVIFFENKLIYVNLNSPIKVKEFMHHLTKELARFKLKNKKVTLIKKETEVVLDDEDFLNLNLSKDILEII